MPIYLQSMIFLKGTTTNIYVYHSHDLRCLCSYDFLKHIYLFLFNFSIHKDALVHITCQFSSHSQVWSQNSTTFQQSTYKNSVKAIVLPLNEIIKLSDVCITSYYDYLFFLCLYYEMFSSNVTYFVFSYYADYLLCYRCYTDKLIASQYGWYCQACHQCPKVARRDKPPLICSADIPLKLEYLDIIPSNQILMTLWMLPNHKCWRKFYNFHQYHALLGIKLKLRLFILEVVVTLFPGTGKAHSYWVYLLLKSASLWLRFTPVVNI